MTNKLPHLPALPFVQIEDALIAWATEYGQQCRDSALEEAAKVCDFYDTPKAVWSVSRNCADKIRGLE